jgi:hypothetical protein
MTTSTCPAAAGTGQLHRLDCRCQVDATPTHEIIHALTAAGWPLQTQGRWLGCRHGRNINRLLGHTTVARATAVRAARMWEQWWDVPGPSARAIAYATRRGWDAPDPVIVARLAAGRRCPRTRLDRDQAVRVLLRRGATPTTISTRLGIRPAHIHAIAASTATVLLAATLPDPIGTGHAIAA